MLQQLLSWKLFAGSSVALRVLGYNAFMNNHFCCFCLLCTYMLYVFFIFVCRNELEYNTSAMYVNQHAYFYCLLIKNWMFVFDGRAKRIATGWRRRCMIGLIWITTERYCMIIFCFCLLKYKKIEFLLIMFVSVFLSLSLSLSLSLICCLSLCI